MTSLRNGHIPVVIKSTVTSACAALGGMLVGGDGECDVFICHVKNSSSGN